MNKIITSLLATALTLSLLSCVCFADTKDNDQQKAYEIAWNNMSDEDKYNASMEMQAWSVGLSVTEFELFARVVEAESDRAFFNEGETTDGRIYVASCIWSRVFSSSFPNTVYGVLTASGQFTTVSGGTCYTSYTKASRWAIIKGLEYLLEGITPSNMYWFNCISYFSGFNAYMKVGDNYFSTTGTPIYFDNAFIIKTMEGFEIREIQKMTIEEEINFLLSKEEADE